jgi:hypothetical protein
MDIFTDIRFRHKHLIKGRTIDDPWDGDEVICVTGQPDSPWRVDVSVNGDFKKTYLFGNGRSFHDYFDMNTGYLAAKNGPTYALFYYSNRDLHRFEYPARVWYSSEECHSSFRFEWFEFGESLRAIWPADETDIAVSDYVKDFWEHMRCVQ